MNWCGRAGWRASPSHERSTSLTFLQIRTRNSAIAWPLAFPTRWLSCRKPPQRVIERRALSTSSRSATGLKHLFQVGPGQRPVRSWGSTTMPRSLSLWLGSQRKRVTTSCCKQLSKCHGRYRMSFSSWSATGLREGQWWNWQPPLNLRTSLFSANASDVPDLLAAADLLVLPSLFEGLPLVVLEAMALGVPVVATRMGGTVEALGQDHPFLVPPDSPSLIASAIVTALRDEVESRNVAIQGKQRFDERFTATRMAQETARLSTAR